MDPYSQVSEWGLSLRRLLARSGCFIMLTSMDPQETDALPTDPAAARDASLVMVIARMAAGDEAALGELYDATLGKVYGLVLRITGQPEAAEDVVGDVYHQAWRQADHYQPDRGRPLTWLLTMARSRALDQLRGRDRAELHPEPEVLAEPLARAEGDPIDVLLTVERASTLHTALARLSPIQRQLLALAFYRDLTHQEIAEQARLPLGTVKTHLRKALLRLKADLSGVAELS
jgi:RNA polymerase sigma-70 factor, ECF subfamily